MASNVGNVDELITCLIGMGFEPDDCRQAVQQGKLDVQAAVEWILSGKPAVASQNPNRLRLHQVRGEQPVPAEPGVTVLGQPPLRINPDDLPTAETGPADSEMSDDVVSRCHMSDEQRILKEKFVDKQRDEARKMAQQDKIAKKRAHERALQQIQEDRERRKRKTDKPEAAVSGSETQAKSGDAVTQAKSGLEAGGSGTQANVEKPEKTDTLIQVRLPNGRAIKRSFPVHMHLDNVCNWVKEHVPQGDNICLMQPFPRKEYSEADLSISLADHGLTPSGSLVLKILPKSAGTAPEPTQSGEDSPMQSPSPQSPPQSPAQSPPMLPSSMHPPPSPAYSWGSGAPLVPQDQSQQEEGGNEEEAEEEEEEPAMEEEQPDMDIPGNWMPGPGPPHPPGMHHHGQLPPLANWQNMGAQDWGSGQRLDGMFAGQQADNRSDNAKQLAAAAARKRFQDAPGPSSEPVSNTPQPQHTVPRLCDMLVRDVTGRIGDPRQPVNSLQGVPANCAQLMLHELIRDGKLRPKTLQPFIACNLRTMILDAYPYTTNDLLQAIRLHTHLAELSLANCPLISDKGILVLSSLKRLRRLSVMGCKQLNNNLFQLLRELPQLTTLTLEDTGITDAGLISYCTTDPPPATLTNLDLSRTQVTHAVLPALSCIPCLRSLCLEMTQLGSLAGIDQLSQLESLNIANTSLVTESLLCLANHPRLKRLNVSNTLNVNAHLALQYLKCLKLEVLQLPDRLTTTSESIKYITEMPLVELDLTNYINIQDLAMQHISQIHTLQRLRLCNTKISDAGLLEIQGMGGLRELLLDRTTVSDVGLSIVNGANFPHLLELSLSETLAGNEYLLSGHLNSCEQLVKLNLSGTQVSDRGIRNMKLPNLTLLNLDRTLINPNLAVQIQNAPEEVFTRSRFLTRISCKNCRGTGNEEET